MKKRKSNLSNKTKPKEKGGSCIIHNFNRYVTLMEDTYGMLFNKENKPTLVKRFTWTNHNRISVAVITYGARIISMKIPDRGANVEEIVLGFDDLAGYLYYDELHLGATIGRTTTKIFKSTYVADGKQYWVTPNDGEHQIRGGYRGLDKVNWEPYVHGNVLQLSYTCADGTNGYQGDLSIRINFELTTGCEFKISMEANTTKVTAVDLSNILYFNLAGHAAGEEELRKHEVLINSNCFTPMDEETDLPTGKIMNVVHTKYNFQVPKLLGEAMGPGPDAAYDQNLCVNRGVDQDNAFVARIIHPYKGRVLEVYSNQLGVNFSNASDFPDGKIEVPPDILSLKPSLTSQELRDNESLFIVISKVAQYFREKLEMKPEEYHGFIRNLLNKLLTPNLRLTETHSFSSELELIETVDDQSEFMEFDLKMILRPLEIQFLLAIKQLIPYVTADIPFSVVKDAIDDILAKQAEADIVPEENSYIKGIIDKQINEIQRRSSEKQNRISESSTSRLSMRKSAFRELQEKKEREEKMNLKSGVQIPPCYKRNRLVGRGGVIYKKYSGISLRTQGYPNGLLEENFPKPIIRPHETYRHTITYKFWILAGDPAKWLRRLEFGPCDEVQQSYK